MRHLARHDARCCAAAASPAEVARLSTWVCALLASDWSLASSTQPSRSRIGAHAHAHLHVKVCVAATCSAAEQVAAFTHTLLSLQPVECVQTSVFHGTLTRVALQRPRAVMLSWDHAKLMLVLHLTTRHRWCYSSTWLCTVSIRSALCWLAPSFHLGASVFRTEISVCCTCDT